MLAKYLKVNLQLLLADPTFCTPVLIDFFNSGLFLRFFYNSQYNFWLGFYVFALPHHADSVFYEDISNPTERQFTDTHTHSEDLVYVFEYSFKNGAPPFTAGYHSSGLIKTEIRSISGSQAAAVDDYLHRSHVE